MTALIKVLIVDDSPIMRYAIAKHLETDPGLTVVGSAPDGLAALAKIPALTPDVVALDAEMPGMNSLATLQQIMRDFPIPVVMLSSLTQHGANITVQALMQGAVDFVKKPVASTEIRTVVEELAIKIKAAARVRSTSTAKKRPVRAYLTTTVKSNSAEPAKLGLRPFRRGDPVVIIGASTGGPRALQQILSAFPAAFPAAVVIVQHMPPGFSHYLAQRLNETCQLTVQEAADGSRLACGMVLVTPGDVYLRFKEGDRIFLDQDPHPHHLRPALDIALESAAKYHGSAVNAIILTGLGSDGTRGARIIKAAGGRVIAEDGSTSVVCGLPGSVFEAGLADRVKPLPEIAPTVLELIAHKNNETAELQPLTTVSSEAAPKGPQALDIRDGQR